MANLPQPINGTEEYLRAIYNLLDERLPKTAQPADAAAPVELKEPAARKAPKKAT